MAKTYFDKSRFQYIGNIPNLLSVGYRFTCEKSYSYQLYDRYPAKLRITTGETKTGVNTSIDFTVTPSYRVAILKKDGFPLFDKIAVAYDPVANKVSPCVGATSNSLTFNAISNGGTNRTVYIFYLLGEGNIRVQISNPGNNIISSTALIEGGIEDINIKDQGNVEDYLYLAEPAILTDAMKLELAFLTRAPIYMDSRDLVSAMTFDCAPSLIFFPVEAKRTPEIQGINEAKKQLNVM